MLVLEVLLTQALVGLVQIFDGKNNCLLKRIQLVLSLGLVLADDLIIFSVRLNNLVSTLFLV